MDKDVLNQRVVQVFNFLLEEGLVAKKGDLAERLDCSPQTITEILGGRQGVKVNLLQKIFDVFDVSYEFIFKGKKPILNAMKPVSSLGNELNQDNFPEKENLPIPMVDISVAAGDGFLNPDYLLETENIYLPEHFVKSGKQYLCVKVKGISMIPTLQDGSYLIVRMLERYEWEHIRSGEVYIIGDREGRSFVKRIENRLKQQGVIICHSDNPDKINFPPFHLTEDEINTVWYAEWYFTPQMPDIHASYYSKVTELEENYNELRSEIVQLKNKLTSGKS